MSSTLAPVADKPRILVIRGGAIGDFILTLPAIRLLREAFPDAHIEILGYQHIVALAERRFYADATKSIEYGPMAGFFVPRSELAEDLSEYFASFQQVISYLFDPDGFFEANVRRAGVKNYLPAYIKIDDSDHAARQLARPLQSLALFLEESGAQVHPTAEDRAAAALLLKEGPGPVVALHPGSGSGKKNWPLSRWQELGERLMAQRPEASLLVVGGEADEAQLEMLGRVWRERPVRIVRGQPLPQLAALLERCEMFLGHDSGISHLAAAVGTRCCLLFGPTDPSVWAPGNRGVMVIEAPEGELGQLEVETVLERINSQWK